MSNKSFGSVQMQIISCILVAAGTCQMAVAQTLEPTSAGRAIAHLDGVEIEFDASGQWSKIYSTYVHPVEFPDRRGIKKAQIIAEEKGKAAIVRFLNQEVQSDRLVVEMESTTADTKSTKATAAERGAVKIAERKMVESVREFTRSYASGSIKGLTVVEVGYDQKKEEAWVKVGFSRTTMGIAEQVRNDIYLGHSGETNPISGKDAINPQPSEDQYRKLP
jgi:hypothetical protein